MYKNESHVLYEIANEPNNVAWSTVLSYHNSVINAIRLIDSETIIIAGTTTWSQDIHLAAATPVNQPYNVMYTFHFYAASHGDLYDRVVAYINTIPIFVTEWGISAANGGGGYDTVVAQQFLDLFASIDSTILSWTMWNWSDKDETSSILENPNSCSNQEWTAVTCHTRFVENYFKSEDYSLMIACNSSGYVPAAGPSVTPFVEEHEWLFWVLGALALLGIGAALYHYDWDALAERGGGGGKDKAAAAFQSVSGGGDEEAAAGAGHVPPQENPYNAKSDSSRLPLRSAHNASSSPPPSPSAARRQTHQALPQQQHHHLHRSQQQTQQLQPQPQQSGALNLKAPTRMRPGQRRQKPSTANSRSAAQQRGGGGGGVQMQNSRR